MPEAATRKIALDDVLETAASGVLRALDARGRGGMELNARDLVKSGFFIDLIIRVGGIPGPIDVLGQKQIGPGGQ